MTQQLASGRKRFITLLAQTVASFIFTIPVLVLAWGETHVEEHVKAIISLVLGKFGSILGCACFLQASASVLDSVWYT